MAAVARWTPLRDALRFQDEVNRIFDFSNRGYPANGEPFAGLWQPAIDIYEDAEGVTLKAELPGVASEDIDLRIENNTLTLKGERKLEKEEQKENYRRVERSYGGFSRAFSLPPTVDAEKVRAESKNGVLSIFLPKREETKPKQIHVKVE